MKLRLPWRRRPETPVEPSRPHAFREIDDPGLGAYAAGGGGAERWVPATVVMTDNFVRKSRCGVPGCDRERHDPVHQVPDPA